MKTMKLVLVLLIAGSASLFAQKKEVKVEESKVEWTGKKIGGSHYGEIQLESGYFEFKNNQMVSGEIIINMNSISNEDLEDQTYKEKLVGHLKSDDFFGVEKYPTSTFVLTEATPFKDGKASLSGTITIKDKTEKITFDVIQKDNKYIAQINIDRSKFDVRYGSNSFFDNLGDKAINDIFTLDINLAI